MVGLSYADFRAAVLDHYRNKTYAAGLDLIDREAFRFRQYAGRISHWQACLYGAAGLHKEALAALQGAVDTGYWFAEEALQISDLEGARALPDFGTMEATCRERQTRAKAQTKPFLISRLQASAPQPAPLLLAMHGNFSNAADSLPAWEGALADGWFLGLAQSSQVSGPDTFVWNDWTLAEQEIKTHYGSLCDNPVTDCSRTVLGGFSMGGGLSAWLSLTGAIPVQGFVAVGPWIEDFEALKPHLAGARDRGLRAYIIVGDQDRGCYPVSQQLAAALREHDIPCELEVHPGLGHEYPANMEQSLRKALAFITNA